MKKIILILLLLIALIALAEAAKGKEKSSKCKGKSAKCTEKSSKCKSKEKSAKCNEKSAKSKEKSAKGKSKKSKEKEYIFILKIDYSEICDPYTTSIRTKAIWAAVSTNVKNAFRDGKWTSLDFSKGLPVIPTFCWSYYIKKLSVARRSLLLNVFAPFTSDCSILRLLMSTSVFKATSLKLSLYNDNVFVCVPSTIMYTWSKDTFTAYLSRVSKIKAKIQEPQAQVLTYLFKKYYKKIDTVDLFNKVKGSLSCMPYDVCKTIPDSVLIAKINDWKDVDGLSCKSSKYIYNAMSRKWKKHYRPKYSCANFRYQCAKSFAYKLKKTAIDTSKWLKPLLSTTFADCLDMKSLWKTLSCTDIPRRDCYSARLNYEIRKKCKGTKQLSTLSNEEVRTGYCTNGALTTLPIATLGSLPWNGLCANDCLKEMCTATTDSCGREVKVKEQKLTISRRCFLNSNTNIVTALGRMKCGCLPLSQKYINKMTSAEQCRALKTRMAACGDGRRYAFSRCAKKLLTADGLVQVKEFVGEMDSSLLCKVAKVSAITQLLSASGLIPTRDQIVCMARRIVKVTKSEDILGIMRKYKVISVEVYKLYPQVVSQSTDRLQDAVTLCENMADAKPEDVRRVKRLMVQGLTDLMSASDTNAKQKYGYMKYLSEEHVNSLSDQCLALFDVEELAAAPTCADVCTKISSQRRFLCKEQSETCTQYATQCMKCLVGGVDSAPRSLTFEDTEKLQNFMCCLSAEDFGKVDQITESRAAVITLLSKCPARDVITAYAKKWAAAVLQDEEVELPGGNLLSEVELSLKSNSEQNTLYDRVADAAEDIVTSTKDSVNTDQCEIKAGADLAAFYSVVKRAVLNTAATANRRKRTTIAAAYTCVNLQMMQDAAESLTEEEWNKFPVTELSECLALIGDLKLTAPITRLLLDKVGKADGSMCDVEASKLTEMNWLLTAMTSDELKCLKNVDVDVLAVMGKIHTWTPEQLKVIASKAKSDNKISLTSGDNIGTLGHAVCGYDVKDIDAMASDVYRDGERSLDKLLACPRDQLVSLKKIAVKSENHGPVSAWDSVDYMTTGLVLATFSAEDFEHAQKFITDWRDTAIALIRGEDLKLVSVENLQKIKNKLTPEQIRNLTPEQKAIFSIVDSSVGCRVPSAGMMMSLLCVIVALLVCQMN